MKKKILLVEDNAENRYLATFLLQGSRFAITPCETGAAALRMLQVERFDLVLLDLQLPDMSGVEIARHIRETLGLGIPIVAVSAFALPGSRRSALDSGCTAFLEKPIDPGSFADQVAMMLPAA
jgi:CheY-like chemotaxis protein